MRTDHSQFRDQDLDLKLVYDYYDQKNKHQKSSNDQKAPTKHYRMGYQKFMNFQRMYVFQTPEGEDMDERPLKTHQLRKLIRLIDYIHAKYKSGSLSKQDIKGIWAILSFIFPSRTGLFMNQFFSMIAGQRLTLDIFSDSQIKRQVSIVLVHAKEEEWFSDKEFIQNLETLIKQAKTGEKQEHEKLFMQFSKVIEVLEENEQYRRQINDLISSMTNFGVLSQVNVVETERQEWKRVINNFAFEPDYVLSEPDTLVADICQQFGQKEYNFIRRKLSDHHQDLDDETETNVIQRTATSKKTKPQENEEDMTMKFKRRINFDIKPNEQNTRYNTFFSSNNEDDQKTRQHKKQKRCRPNHKNYIDKMMKNYRRINQKFVNRIQRKRKTQSKVQTVRNQNIFIQKQIKKNTFIDTSVLVNRRDKRNVPRQNYARYGNEKSLSRQKHSKQSQQSLNWNEKFIEDDSVNDLVSISSHLMEVQEEYSNRSTSQKNKRKRTSQRKVNNNQRKPRQSRSPKEAKEVKVKRVDYRKRQNHASHMYIQSSEQQHGFYEVGRGQKKTSNREKSGQRVIQEKKTKIIEKRQKGNFFQNQENNRNQGKKEKQLKRLKRQVQGEEINENSNNYLQSNNGDSSFLLNYEEVIQNSQSIGLNYHFQKLKVIKERQNQLLLSFPKTNQDKYSHLLYNPEKTKENKSIKANQQNTLDNFVRMTKDMIAGNFEPLQRLEIRKLSILEFQETEQAAQRMMIVEGDELNPFQKMRKEINEYELIQMKKMEFSLTEYMSYLSSLETKQQVFKEIKQIANEYLSKTFGSDESRRKTKKNQDNVLKLVLISRKILVLYVLSKKQLQNQSNRPQILSHFSSTYITPLLNHYFYKISVQIYAEIINALFTSEGDEDFDLLNQASLPFMMLLHDIRQLSYDKEFSQIKDFCKSIYEEMYQIFNQQSAIIMIDLIRSIKQGSLFAKAMTQKLQLGLKPEVQNSNIHLPRPTKEFIEKSLRFQLHPINLMFSSFVAFMQFQVGFYEKLQFIFSTMSEAMDLKRIKELRAFKFSQKNEKGEKGSVIDVMDCIVQGINSLNFEDKGISQIYNLAQILAKLLSRLDFFMQSKQRFSMESKIVVLLTKSLKEICRSSGPTVAGLGSNQKFYEQNQRKQKILHLIKQCLSTSIRQFVIQQTCKPINFLSLINIIIKQQLKDLAFQATFIPEQYILVELNLEIISTLMTFPQFRENQILNRPQVIKIIERILNDVKQNRAFAFAGKNRLGEVMRRCFDILMVGYKCQIYEKGNWYQVNEQIYKENNIFVFLQKKDLAQEYWNLIKQVVKMILAKCKEYSSIPTLSHSYNNNSARELQTQKLKTYSTLLTYILNQLTSELNNSKFFNVQKLFTYCRQENCIAFSLRHVLVNLSSFLSELDFFVQLDFANIFSDIDLSFNLHPMNLAKSLSNLLLVDKEKKNLQKLYEDEEERDSDEMYLAIERDETKPFIVYKWLQIVCSRLEPNELQSKIKSLQYSSPQSSSILGLISAIQYFKRLFLINTPIQNNSQNQKQKSLLTKMPLFLQVMKKHEYLAFAQNSPFGQAAHKEIKENEIQDSESMFEAMYSFSMFILPLFDFKKHQELFKLAQQFVRKLTLEANTHKINILNILGSVILKNLIFYADFESCFKSATSKKEKVSDVQILIKQKTDKHLTLIQLYCKLYEISHNTNLAPHSMLLLTDSNSLLYIVFNSISSKKKSNSKQLYEYPAFYLLLDTCSEIYRVSYLNGETSKRNFFNAIMTNLIESLYNYMKQLSSYLNTLKQRNQAVNIKFSQHTLAIAYLKLFNTVISWPSLLTSAIQKTKMQFEILISKDPTQIFTKGKSLLENLINQNQNEDNELSFNHSPNFNLKKTNQTMKLLEDCLLFVQRLQANVYDIKVTIPQWIFLYVMKKVVESQIQTKQPSPAVLNKISYLTQTYKQTSKETKPLNLLLKLIQSLSLFDSSVLLEKIIVSCIKFLAYQKSASHNHTHLNASKTNQQQKTDFQTFELRIHLMGKKEIPDYRKKLLITVLMVAKYSTKHRILLEKMFWEHSAIIDKFIQKNRTENHLQIVQNNKKSLTDHQKRTNYQDNIEESLPEAFEELIANWLIGYDSDFYLIKMLINTRTQLILSSNQYSLLESESKKKLSLLILALEKSINIMQGINRSHQINNRRQFCNEDLEEWFRSKLSFINELIEKHKYEVQNQLSGKQAENPSVSNNNQNDLHLSYLIKDTFKRESTKMEIQ